MVEEFCFLFKKDAFGTFQNIEKEKSTINFEEKYVIKYNRVAIICSTQL